MRLGAISNQGYHSRFAFEIDLVRKCNYWGKIYDSDKLSFDEDKLIFSLSWVVEANCGSVEKKQERQVKEGINAA